MTDLKSGSHHIRSRPECFKTLCFEFAGELYHFACLPFGT